MVNWDQAKRNCADLQKSVLVEIDTGGENRYLTGKSRQKTAL